MYVLRRVGIQYIHIACIYVIIYTRVSTKQATLYKSVTLIHYSCCTLYIFFNSFTIRETITLDHKFLQLAILFNYGILRMRNNITFSVYSVFVDTRCISIIYVNRVGSIECDIIY